MVVIKITRCCVNVRNLSSEAIQGPALALESIDNIKCCHCLPASMLCVGHCIPDDILQEDLQDTSCLLIDEPRNTLDSTSASKSADGWLCDSLDVIPENLSVTLSTSLSCKTLSPIR